MIARLLIIALLLLTGVNGLIGGYAVISNPDSPFGIPVSILKNGPFKNFLIPGIILLSVIGVGSLVVAILIIKRIKLYEYILGIMSLITMGWIVIQVCIMIEINVMHVTIFAFALIEAAYSIYLLIKENKYPFNII